MLETAFTRLVGCQRPLQLAPVGGRALVRAVCDAGGLGTVATPLLTPAALDAELAALAAETRGPFGVNFLMPFLDRAAVEVAARRARVVEFFYGAPDAELVRLARAHGALAAWQAGSLAEAQAAEDAGCDFVVAQGVEAGGHVRGTEPLASLLPRAVAALRVPVVAAGGLATARDVADALATGAAGVRLGTRFVASRESDAHPDYVAALLAARAEDTVLTEAFGSDWPNAPHRTLRSAVAAAHALHGADAGAFRLGAKTLPVRAFSSLPPKRDTTGRIDAMALYAGESVARIDAVRGAGELVAALCDEAERLLAARAR